MEIEVMGGVGVVVFLLGAQLLKINVAQAALMLNVVEMMCLGYKNKRWQGIG